MVLFIITYINIYIIYIILTVNINKFYLTCLVQKYNNNY